MMKEDAIKRFRECCYNEDSIKRRKVAVESQFNRDVWEVYISIGKIRIRKDDTRYDIEIFGYTIAHAEYPISEHQYNELKDLYFGEFKPNEEYLTQLNSILS